MRKSKVMVALLAVFVMFALTAGTMSAAPQKAKKQETKQPEKVYIPKQIKALMTEGLATRQGRQDIPFEIFRTLHLPAQMNFHMVFFFKVKNSDLGYTVSPAGDSVMAKFHIFLQLLQPDEKGGLKIYKEIYVPGEFQEPAEGYVPDEAPWYSVGLPLPAGKYTLAMAITSPDLQKAGINYHDFELTGIDPSQTSLSTSSVLFIKDLQQMPTPDQTVKVYKGMFTYSVLQFSPNIDFIVSLGENIEIFYFIFGAKTTEAAEGTQPKSDIQVSYEVQDLQGKAQIKYQAQAYDFSLISQALPMKQTVLIKDDKGERQEQRDLPAGQYQLVMNITDKISGNTLEVKAPFEVK